MPYIWDHSSKTYGGTEFSESTPGTGITLGMTFWSTEPVEITHVGFWKVSADTATSRTIAVYDASGNVVASGSSSGEATGSAGWVEIALDTPLTTVAFDAYTAAVFHTVDHMNYPASSGYFTLTGYDSADSKVHAASTAEADAASAVNGNGTFGYDSAISFPTGEFGAADYWVDVKYTGGTTEAAAGAASGTAAATSTGHSTASTAGSAAGSTTAAAAGRALKSATGTAAGVGSAAATGRPRAATAGAAAGSATVNGSGARRTAAAASATGTAGVVGVGFLAGIVAVVGNAAGTATALGIYVLQSAPERTLLVPREQRALSVLSENRTLQVTG